MVFYRTEADAEPVRDWLKGLTTADKKIIGKDIKTVQYGWPIGMTLVRKLEPGLWEVRVQLDQRIARILFTVSGKSMVLLHGFFKTMDKTPKREMDMARNRKRDLER